MTFQQKLDSMVSQNNSLVCVGLDPDWEKLPEISKKEEYPQFAFNKAIIDATHDLVSSFKPNSAFYEAFGSEGIRQLKMTCDYLKDTYPGIPVILDFKRGDIGSTNEAYATYAFDYLRVDAITLHPYLGKEALQPFLDHKDKGCIILCRTSNSGAGEFQDLNVILGSGATPGSPSTTLRINSDSGHLPANALHSQVQAGARMTSIPLYKIVARKVSSEWNVNGNCLLVVGATYPEELAEVRRIAGDMTFLVPGIGAQGGEVEATLNAGLNSKKAGLILNASRSITFASKETDFDKVARQKTIEMRDMINVYRK